MNNIKEWKFNGNCFEMVCFSGSQCRRANVLQGGNGLWTAWVHQFQVKLTKRGKESRNPTTVKFEMMKPQAATKEQAITWAEETWCHFPELKDK